MYVPLVPCPSCARHVRHTEASCPFCREELGAELAARIVPDTNRRMSRAAAFVFASTVAVSACGGSTTVDDDGSTSSTDASSGNSTSTSGEGSTGPGMPLYGGPAVGGAGGTSSVGGAGGAGGDPAGAGGAQADYGAPPPPDN